MSHPKKIHFGGFFFGYFNHEFPLRCKKVKMDGMNLSQYSRYATHVRLKYANELTLLEQGIPSTVQFTSTLCTLLTRFSFEDALRILRHLVLERLLMLDCDQGLPLKTVMACISEFAEFALHHASAQAINQLSLKYGNPSVSSSQASNIFILAMGKLAARELNISSDIDLVYIYDHEGETSTAEGAGLQTISNQEFYLKWAQLIFQFISKENDHGFVFRIDLNLRPYGTEGLKVISSQALADYFQKTARPWERFAWYKSRCLGFENSKYSEIYRLITDFVHRKYHDYSLIDSLRGIHRSIQTNLKTNSSLNVKLSRGGIREIEFGVQLLQLIRSGVEPELRSASTFEAIQLLMKAGLLSTSNANQLEVSYTFLRQLEHRIQYLDDLQTHDLPSNSEDLHWISQAMGFQEVEAFMKELEGQRQFVANLFERLLTKISMGNDNEAQNHEAALSANQNAKLLDSNNRETKTHSDASLCDAFLSIQKRIQTSFGDETIFDLSRQCLNFFESIDERAGQAKNKERKDSLDDLSNARGQKIHRILRHIELWLSHSEVAPHQIQSWFTWMEPLLRRDHYWSMFDENPALLLRVMQLMGASNWSQQYLSRYPGVVNELVIEIASILRFDAQDFEGMLQQRRDYLRQEGHDDEENLLSLLRKAHHSAIFKILVQDLSGHLTLEQVADDLSALANSIVKISINWIWSMLSREEGANSPLSVLAYGKLGSLELGYGSDLDLVFLYDETCGVEYELINKMAKKMITWFTLKTQDGDLYEIDSALRPNGFSGLLVSEINTFERYQLQIDKNNAWTWEHQALTRARFCVGEDSIKDRFNRIRSEVLSRQRDPINVREDVSQMRLTMWKASKVKEGDFDLKQSPGGMIDAEFVVQYLILSHAWSHPELLENVGNIALLNLSQNLNLLPNDVGRDAANAYRRLRQLQHQARLAASNLAIKKENYLSEIQSIQNLWLSCFDRYW
jgi:glutamate-ammonia-ligase adenylyltransferase